VASRRFGAARTHVGQGAQEAFLRLTYGDLWQVYRQGRLHIDDLEAEQFDMILERQADGRASWEFKPHQPSASGSVSDLPTFGRLRVAWGRVTLRDAKSPLDITARYSLSDGSGPSGPTASAEPPVAAASQGIRRAPPELLERVRRVPLRAEQAKHAYLPVQDSHCRRQP
jgi:hypothetical protein